MLLAATEVQEQGMLLVYRQTSPAVVGGASGCIPKHKLLVADVAIAPVSIVFNSPPPTGQLEDLRFQPLNLNQNDCGRVWFHIGLLFDDETTTSDSTVVDSDDESGSESKSSKSRKSSSKSDASFTLVEGKNKKTIRKDLKVKN
ncbi:hypothetical protein EVAR_66703_1 [Eumeta japonica]|uniref:Uncharacterized protein n=1 Tax=Eumeta variegata TaxID=151549 RepID=A0A4C1ZSU5_EUMVA|nr:hypothetical protein EVAR_66703_1 [Eumeta japonica]